MKFAAFVFGLTVTFMPHPVLKLRVANASRKKEKAADYLAPFFLIFLMSGLKYGHGFLVLALRRHSTANTLQTKKAEGFPSASLSKVD